MINSFSGDNAFLSNFYELAVPITDPWDIKYPTVEHFFQASKTLDISERNKIAKAKTPGAAKRLGRALDLRKDWDEVKLEYMRLGLMQKFYNNKDLAKKLIDTGGEFLVEGNTWDDTFWGVCNGKGRNNLGHLLMIVRDILIKEQSK